MTLCNLRILSGATVYMLQGRCQVESYALREMRRLISTFLALDRTMLPPSSRTLSPSVSGLHTRLEAGTLMKAMKLEKATNASSLVPAHMRVSSMVHPAG